MADGIDRRGILEGQPFAYQTGKDGAVRIAYMGRTVVVLGSKQSTAFIKKAQGLDTAALQLLMAKATGNFKRGNERLGKQSPKG